MNSKKTIVLGASNNPGRYSFMAVNRLKQSEYEVIPVGIKKGEIAGIPIQNGQPFHEGVDTVTLYIGPANQKEYYDYLMNLKPNRVIFNPGTINYELMELLQNEGIEVVDACTLVMLSADTY